MADVVFLMDPDFTELNGWIIQILTLKEGTLCGIQISCANSHKEISN